MTARDHIIGALRLVVGQARAEECADAVGEAMASGEPADAAIGREVARRVLLAPMYGEEWRRADRASLELAVQLATSRARAAHRTAVLEAARDMTKGAKR